MTRFFLINFFLFLLIGCSLKGKDVSGTTNDTETGNSVAGYIKNGEGKPLSDLKVYIYSENYIASANDSLTTISTVYFDSTFTDSTGKFQIEVPKENSGNLIVEALVDTGSVIRTVIHKAPDISSKLDTLIILPTGNVSGSVKLPKGELGKILVQIKGTLLAKELVGDSVGFNFENLPIGKYTLLVSGVNPLRDTVPFEIEVTADQTLQLLPVQLGAAEENTNGGVQGSVVLPENHFGKIRVAFKDFELSQELEGDSVEFSFLGIPEGVYTLLISGFEPVRDTIETNVRVNQGQTSLINTIFLGVPLKRYTGKINGTLVLPKNTFGKGAVQLYEVGQTINLDSNLTFSYSDLSPGIYTIKGWGGRPERDTVETMVEVFSGKISHMELALKELSVLIVDGVNNHDWVRMSAAFKSILEQTDLFNVSISTTPPYPATHLDWAGWNPDFFNYDAVIVNYIENYYLNGDTVDHDWPDSIKVQFENFVSSGRGAIFPQSSILGHETWPAYNEMIGLAWRDPSFGPGMYLDSNENLFQIPIGTPRQIIYPHIKTHVHTLNESHPINLGLPKIWLHPEESVDYSLRGPQKNMTLLGYAENPASAQFEPIVWTTKFENGRAFTFMLGDVVVAGPDSSLRCSGLQTLIQRGAEWVITEEVTQIVPIDFPTMDSISIRDNLP